MRKIKKIVDLSWEFTAETPIYPGDPHSLAHNNISDIIQDLHGNYWISTIGGGLDKLHGLH